MLEQNITLRQVADAFKVHLNSVEHRRQCWLRLGLVGLYEGWHSGRPPTLSRQEQCELLYFDEASFGLNSPIQYGWMRKE